MFSSGQWWADDDDRTRPGSEPRPPMHGVNARGPFGLESHFGIIICLAWVALPHNPKNHRNTPALPRRQHRRREIFGNFSPRRRKKGFTRETNSRRKLVIRVIRVKKYIFLLFFDYAQSTSPYQYNKAQELVCVSIRINALILGTNIRIWKKKYNWYSRF